MSDEQEGRAPRFRSPETMEAYLAGVRRGGVASVAKLIKRAAERAERRVWTDTGNANAADWIVCELREDGIGCAWGLLSRRPWKHDGRRTG